MEGDDHGEAYTAIVRGELLSREINEIAEAQPVHNGEGNMCGAAMRGTVALPRSKSSSRTKGSGRKLGDLAFDRCANASARIGKARSRSR